MTIQTQPTAKHTEGSPLREQARIIDTKAKEIVIGETWAIYVRINGCAHEITGHTKEQAEANAVRIVKCVNNEWKIDMHEKLVSVIESAYKCSGEINHLTKPILDEMKILLTLASQK